MGQGRRIIRWAVGLCCIVAVGLSASFAPSPLSAGATAPHNGTGQTQSNFWLATPSGGLYTFGTPFFGSPGGPLNRPVVGITTTSDRRGYWLVASDGGVFTYGDAGFFGSTGNLVLNRPIVGLAPNPDTAGYWLVASDGGVFTFGDATFYGSTGNLVLNQPIVSMAATPDGHGYWLVASDGGVFTFGDAGFFGSSAGSPGDPVQRIVPTRSGGGYWIVQQNGTEAGFGDASAAPNPVAVLLSPVTQGDRAVLFALQQLGKPYIWGGNGPVGYDCSGLTLTSWRSADGVSFARVANDQYHTAGAAVAMTALRAGDLVFWGYNQADWTTVYHTALYIGGNRIVEATGDHVQLNALGQWGTGDLMPVGRRP